MKIFKNFLLLAACGALLLFSCSKDEQGVNFDSNALDELSGKEIFKSVLFADGVLTSKIPVLANNFDFESYFDDDELQLYRELQDEVLGSIDSQYPEYFASFKRTMRSNNFELIRQAITEASTIVVKASMQLHEADYEKGQELTNSLLEDQALKGLKIDAEGRKIMDLRAGNLRQSFLNDNNAFVLNVVVLINVATAVNVVNVAVAVNAVAAVDTVVVVTREEEEPPEDQQRDSNSLILDEISASIIAMN
ncbi:hypothetical protein ACFQ1M_08200 [Sungkyunkwania multivorans]|uniref:Lipoprotein n=1 Tax=Sungkyunkwania multivorans TaxID=1173618 RepID=A0ABW3D029_9FLAO